ncbi:UDP-N-acetylenolpyruvoylglucosamine reductase [Candidatus Berkelbacteria bacterium CG10_big_fil_rev_8_21_14_0_10_43_13]|uniref:UDP-N-acetylenolpyruvoylglucosamine reductase n=1 Tax=Candidatus Berkelbacteria bacterium CG10_big_fil_rev_8_21_14_0_10_43_13 TaxID=1974514 RepID=A0A2H0W719_9BACT|nr:MAG: UDP-N-acetylenolpyruvoylglucosamine reductase [Candidatus Berkelbacteria bacterium CG10_big_fil_rev_8_21_14_0_10_43_13]
MKDIDAELRKILGEDLRQNVVLRDYVSMKVGGVADFFYSATDINNLTLAVSAAVKLKIPYFILGGGYNIIPSDLGFPGLVIKNDCSNIVFSPDFSGVIADSGVNLGRLINQATSHDLGGLEFLFGVPSSVGGAVYGNAGALGQSIGDFVKSVTLLIPKDDTVVIVRHSPAWMSFAYRSSILKTDYRKDKHKPVILTVTLQLVQRRKDEILRMTQENMAVKKKNQPLGEISAGSFFKNLGALPENSAGYLIDHSGAKKLRVGGAAFSKKHANFLINRKNATASDVHDLAEKAKELVKEKYDCDLEEEIEYIGRW